MRERRWRVRKDERGWYVQAAYPIAWHAWSVLPETRRNCGSWAGAMGYANLMTWIDRGRELVRDA